MIPETKNLTSSLAYQRKGSTRKRELVTEFSEETVNEQVARPFVDGSLLSVEVVDFLTKERIKTQEYQEVRNLIVLD